MSRARAIGDDPLEGRDGLKTRTLAPGGHLDLDEQPAVALRTVATSSWPTEASAKTIR